MLNRQIGDELKSAEGRDQPLPTCCDPRATGDPPPPWGDPALGLQPSPPHLRPAWRTAGFAQFPGPDRAAAALRTRRRLQPISPGCSRPTPTRGALAGLAGGRQLGRCSREQRALVLSGRSLSWKITCDGCHSGPCSSTAASPEQEAAHTESHLPTHRYAPHDRRSGFCFFVPLPLRWSLPAACTRTSPPRTRALATPGHGYQHPLPCSAVESPRPWVLTLYSKASCSLSGGRAVGFAGFGPPLGSSGCLLA
ncbi:uncharacterized protein LOC122675218 [Cervus elaphus]|uniref:uncharacterized protein LOC122675218 n=1 Tax=Cervus elaphus TaxID=9860 RepID=UPI001CC2C03F|nr:uncharacterized protein LOC122675218 [Cervus elaphus]